MAIDLHRTQDRELLRQVALVQDSELKRLHAKLNEVLRENAALRKLSPADAAARAARLFEDSAGKPSGRSERRPRPKAEDGDKPEKPEKKGHGPRAQPALPIEEVVHTLDEADQICPACGGGLEKWAGQFDDSEEIDVVELQYRLIKHRRQKYRCRCASCVETALGPTKLISGGRYSLGFAVHVAIAKYLEHMPLERQVRRMKRQGLIVESQTLWDQIWALALKLEPTAERIHAHVLRQDVAIGDETHWKRLEHKKNGFTWTLVTGTATSYKVLESRSNDAADKMLEGFGGVLVTDGYVIYPSQSKKRGFVLAHDWCHMRRRFIEAEPTAPPEAGAFLDDIGNLFLIEREIAEVTRGLGPEDAQARTLEIRQARSKPLINAIGRRAIEIRAVPGTPLAQAIGYLDRHWHGLTVFVNDPRVPLTSNAAESALRKPVLGRKNYLGSRSDRGMRVAGVFYTLIATCLQNAVEPAAYLHEAALAALRGEIAPLPHDLASTS